jgi:SAM-dependent methyltransferase
MGIIDRSEGQRAFGCDPAGYHQARPGYPSEVFELLQERCGLRPACRTLEIGPGTGLCTRRLIELGASPMVLVEPDERLADYLNKTLGRDKPVDVRLATFESVDLPVNWFDLGTCASAFHWLDEKAALSKIADVLRPGAWWAMWWNLFFDGSRNDEFHRATHTILAGLDHSPSRGGFRSYALDADARIAHLLAQRAFENIQFNTISWSAVFDTRRLIALYATFSPISRLEPEKRQRLLDDLARIADVDFHSEVELQITTPMYTAQRQSVRR